MINEDKTEFVLLGDLISLFQTDIALHLYSIRKINKYLGRESLVRLINALVLSHLDYSNALLFGLPDPTIWSMQNNIQNSAARLILSLSKFEHITPSLQQLYWLPIRYRIQFKIMTFLYKAVHNVAPEHICDLIELKQSKYSLRSFNGVNLSEQRSHPNICGRQRFHQMLGLRKLFIFLKSVLNFKRFIKYLRYFKIHGTLDIRYCRARMINKLFIWFCSIIFLF